MAPDSVEFLSQLGDEFTGFFDSIGFDWKRLAGAKVVEIDGKALYDYVDFIAKTVSGNYLDHGVRVNSVFSSYRISDTAFSQRIGDLAGPIGVKQTSLKMKLIPAGSESIETVDIPFLANYLGLPFTDKESLCVSIMTLLSFKTRMTSISSWAANCAANDGTNGVDLKGFRVQDLPRKLARGEIIDKSGSNAIDLPPPFLPNTTAVPGSEGVIKSFILPDNKTGVVRHSNNILEFRDSSIDVLPLTYSWF